MARLSDHDQRDAEDVLRSEIRLILAQYARRMLDKGKAAITEAIAQAVKDGGDLDGPAIGKIAAARVKAEYFAPGKPQTVIDTAPPHKRIGASSGKTAK